MATYEIIFKGQSDIKNPIMAHSGMFPLNSESEPGVSMYGYAKKITTRIMSHNINTIGLRTGQSELQEIISFTHNVGLNAWSFLEMVAMGGGAAGLPGAIVGGALSLGNNLLNIVFHQDIININRSAEDIAISRNNLRAGIGQRRREI